MDHQHHKPVPGRSQGHGYGLVLDPYPAAGPAGGWQASMGLSQLQMGTYRHHAHPLPLPAPPSVTAMGWCEMLGEVRARLHLLLAQAQQSQGTATPHSSLLALSSGLLQCVQALDRLEPPIKQALGQTSALQQALRDAQLTLGHTRSQLQDTQARERNARRQARQDGLTELPNQTHFRAQLQQALATTPWPARGLAVFYLDLDNFKSVNDQHGHSVGDALLRIVAARLRATLRKVDTVGRMGGDEFACLVVDPPNQAGLAQLVAKLAATLHAPMQVGALSLQVQASVGIAVWPGDGQDGADLLHHADQAMYEAKRQRSGHAFYQPGVQR